MIKIKLPPFLARSLLLSALLAGTILLGLAPAASADVYVGGTPPRAGPIDAGVSTQVLRREAPRQIQVVSTQRARVSGLAVTGGDILGACALAAIALGAGLVFVRVGREVSS